MKILITRPEPDASRLASILKKMGHETVSAPMMTIENLPGKQVNVDGVQALLVTSANGARALGLATAFRNVRVIAVGEATADAVRSEGFDLVENADGDVASLANTVIATCKPENGKLVHIAGTDVAGDLSGLLTTAGFECERVVLYSAKASMQLDVATIEQLKSGVIDAALFYSPRTATIFCSNIQKAQIASNTVLISAFCLSDAVAEKVSVLSWSQIVVSPEPSQESLLALLTMHDLTKASGKELEKPGEQKVSDKKTGNNNEQDKKATSSKAASVPDSSATKPLGNDKSQNQSSQPGGKTPAAGSEGKSRFGTYVVLLVLVFCLGLAGWPLLYPKLQPYLPAAAAEIISGQFGTIGASENVNSEIKSVQSTLNSKIEQLSDRIDALEKQGMDAPSATNPANTSASVPGIMDDGKITELSENTEQRMAELKTQLEDQVKKLETVTAQLDQQSSEISGLKEAEASISGPSPQVQSEFLDLKNELLDLKTKMGNLQSELAEEQTNSKTQAGLLSSIEASLKAEAGNEAVAKAENKRTLMLLALGQLQRETRTDEPFENGLSQVKAVSDEGFKSEISKLQKVASTGAPTLADLRQEFSGIASEVSQAARLPSDETWYGQALHRIASAVKFRRVDDTGGTDTDSIVARAEQDLATNDLENAVVEVKKLDSAAAEVAKGWLAKAEARLAVETAIAGLLEKATSSAVAQPASN